MFLVTIASLVAFCSKSLAIGPENAPRYLPIQHKGFVFGGDEWSHPDIPFNSSEADEAFDNFVISTGATHVRILVTVYQDYINSTTIYSRVGVASPIRTASNEELVHVISRAKARGMYVALAPVLDPNWDITSNKRASGVPGSVWRGMIGQGFSTSEWNAWFASYKTMIMSYATLAESNKVDLFEIASELRDAFEQESQWRSLIPDIRKAFSGKLTIAGNSDPSQVQWWDLLDFIGVDAYVSLSGATNGTADALVAEWENSFIPGFEAVVNKFSKPLLITEIGYQSRPRCWDSPAGIPRADFKDCSGYLECYGPAAQEQAYEALLRAFSQKEWFAGVYWWLVRTDPTAGGTSDSDFTPLGKPAAQVLARWYDAPPSMQRALEDYPGATGIKTALKRITEQTQPASGKRVLARDNDPSNYYNGFVFGGDSEWSSPNYRYDSTGARESLDALKATGANTVQIVTMWYYNSNNDTVLYAIGDQSSTLRTATSSEIVAIISYAKSIGLTTFFSPMIDPDYDLPGNCRQCASPPGPGWRGTVGSHWGSNCSAGTPWNTWFTTYRDQLILPSLYLASAAKVDVFLLSHELQTVTSNCPDLWDQLIAQARSIYSGKLSIAFNGPIIDNYRNIPWMTKLDWIGVDCYYGIDVAHPDLPWQDANVSAVAAAWKPWAEKLGNMSKYLGNMDIVCTEIGAQSRPWSYDTTSSTPGHQLDPHDCSVWDQCLSVNAQALFYDGMFEVLYAEPWFKGFTLWMWRADPTSGGPSDDAYTPAGKGPSLAILKKYWT